MLIQNIGKMIVAFKEETIGFLIGYHLSLLFIFLYLILT